MGQRDEGRASGRPRSACPDGAVVAALVAVNAVGDVVDPRDGAGARGRALARTGRALRGTRRGPARRGDAGPAARAARTRRSGSWPRTSRSTKAEATKVAQMAHDGLARAIRPVHTPWDGDTLFALSTGALTIDQPSLVVGALAAEAVARAVVRAVTHGHGPAGASRPPPTSPRPLIRQAGCGEPVGSLRTAGAPTCGSAEDLLWRSRPRAVEKCAADCASAVEPAVEKRPEAVDVAVDGRSRDRRLRGHRVGRPPRVGDGLASVRRSRLPRSWPEAAGRRARGAQRSVGRGGAPARRRAPGARWTPSPSPPSRPSPSGSSAGSCSSGTGPF